MKTLTILLIFGVALSGCAFKSIDTCGAEGGGNGCTPIAENLQQARDRSNERRSGQQTPDIAIQADYTEIDRAVVAEEYRRISPAGTMPQYLNNSEVKIRIYPYSDGERFYDVRDIYVLVQKSGWARGSVAYTPNGTVSLIAETPSIPASMVVMTDELNVRIGPNALFESIGTLSKNTVVTLKRYRDGWYYIDATVRKTTISGWVHGGYLK